jgi:hypothetical protein
LPPFRFLIGPSGIGSSGISTSKIDTTGGGNGSAIGFSFFGGAIATFEALVFIEKHKKFMTQSRESINCRAKE